MNDDDLLSLLVTLSASLTLLGSSFIIISYIVFKEYRQFNLRVILYLCTADLFSAVGIILSAQTLHHAPSFGLGQQAVCTLSGAMIEFSQFSSVLWSACVAHMIVQVVGSKGVPERFEKWYFVLSIGVPSAFVIFVLCVGKVGPGPFWCWVEGPQGFWLFETIMSALALLFNLFCLVRVLMKMHRERYGTDVGSPLMERRSLSSLELSFAFFVVALWITWVPGIANGFYDYFTQALPMWMFYVQAACMPLQGFLNAVIYGFNDQLRQSFRKACCPRYSRYSLFDDGGPPINWDSATAYDDNDSDISI